jgi:hypothetical protein
MAVAHAFQSSDTARKLRFLPLGSAGKQVEFEQ